MPILWQVSLASMCRATILAAAGVSCCGPQASAGGGVQDSGLRARQVPDQKNDKAPGTASRQNGSARANRIRFVVRGWRRAAGRTWAFLSVTRQVLPTQTVERSGCVYYVRCAHTVRGSRGGAKSNRGAKNSRRAGHHDSVVVAAGPLSNRDDEAPHRDTPRDGAQDKQTPIRRC
jgi:hypothetical protein